MFPTTLVCTSLVFSAFFSSVLADFAINSPEIKSCSDVNISWQDTGKGPYDLIIVKPDDPCGDAIVDLGGDHKGTTMTWKSTLPAGAKVQLSMQDASGDEAWSQVITTTGTDSSCVPDNLKSLANAAAVPGASSSAKASSSAAASSGTTLVVPPNATPSSSASVAPVAAGGLSGGASVPSGAIAASRVSMSVVALASLAGAVFMML